MWLLFVRHAEPDYTVDSLTPKGWREAALLADRLEREQIDAFYCSPLGRARDTAKVTLNRTGRQAQTLEWLREFHAPVLHPNAGKVRAPWDFYPAYFAADPDFYQPDRWWQTPIMQSGKAREAYDWVCAGLDDLLAAHGYTREGRVYRVWRANTDAIVLFCHFGVECVLLSHLIGAPPTVLWQGMIALPSSVTTVYTEERQQGIASFRIAGFGDVSHLYQADEPPSFAGRFCETYDQMDQRH